MEPARANRGGGARQAARLPAVRGAAGGVAAERVAGPDVPLRIVRRWLCPRGTLETLDQQEKRMAREARVRQLLAGGAGRDGARPRGRDRAARAGAGAGAQVAGAVRPAGGDAHGARAPAHRHLVAGGRADRRVHRATQRRRTRGVGRAPRLRPGHSGVWAALQASFAHAGWLHLLGNVYFLAAFGDGVEQRAPRLAVCGRVPGDRRAGARRRERRSPAGRRHRRQRRRGGRGRRVRRVTAARPGRDRSWSARSSASASSPSASSGPPSRC